MTAQSASELRWPDSSWLRSFRRRLLAWFDQHARDLPWRRNRSLYYVWISEIMLQQTQVVTVIPYFERFVQRFPSIAALADADEQEVLRLWEGLGYYRRARQLHAAARQIVEQFGGEFPTELEQVRSLPGIGRYTAGAILSIATDARHPILEANTIRVFSRLIAYRGDTVKADGQRLLWQLAECLLPRRRAGDLNQALMELGSEICTPRDPACVRCPIASLCPTRELGLQALIPAPKQKMRYEDVREIAIVVWRGEQVLLRRCEPGERWAGLWDFPRFTMPVGDGKELSNTAAKQLRTLTGVRVRALQDLTVIKHGVTRFRITLHCFEAAWSHGEPASASATWRRVVELDELPLSVTGRRIAKLLQSRANV